MENFYFQLNRISSMAFDVDELLAAFVPITVYWLCSGLYMMLEKSNIYRIRTRAEKYRKNMVSKVPVVKVIYEEGRRKARAASSCRYHSSVLRGNDLMATLHPSNAAHEQVSVRAGPFPTALLGAFLRLRCRVQPSN
ncbi:hypothetical protein HPP92_010942 [Vanilla planifolia]|uniref:Uncharacterized protein n=1 Tax=Vanilla planifolia TaxID=51239 RepID=A0A835V309_VANPL|nr:hypothetical protein HPP92_010942 [Vanilla planifolia]